MGRIAISTSHFYLGTALALLGVAMAITWWLLLRVVILTGAAILLTAALLRAEWTVRWRPQHRVAVAGAGVVMIFAVGLGEVVASYCKNRRQDIVQQASPILQYRMPSAIEATLSYSMCVDVSRSAVEYAMSREFQGVFYDIISDEYKARNAIDLSFYASSLCRTVSGKN